MIKKLESKIFLILMISLSIITIGVIVLFTVSNYNNAINTSTIFMDRLFKPDDNKEINTEKPVVNIDGLYRLKILSNDEIQSDNQEYCIRSFKEKI